MRRDGNRSTPSTSRMLRAARLRATLKTLAAADSDYAAGRRSREVARHPRPPARETFLRAAEGIRLPSGAHGAGRPPLRGQTALALAGVEYFDLQDWAKTAEWAKAAAECSEVEDPTEARGPMRSLAAAWLEIGAAARSGRAVLGLWVQFG